MKYLIIALFLFALASSLLLNIFFKQKTLINTLDNIITNCSELNQYQQDKFSVFYEREILEMKHEGDIISSNISILSEFGDTILISSLKSPTMIFRYSEFQCINCVDSQLSIINSLPDKIKEKIVIFGKYSNISALSRFRRLQKLDLEIFKVDSINSELDSQSSPYFFLLDSTNKIENIFFPLTDSTILTSIYLNEMLL